MKLVPTMFYDPEPKPEDFNKVCGFPCKCRDCADVPDSKCGYKLHEEANNEWKRRQIEPGLWGEPFKHYEEHRLRFKGFERIPVNCTDKMYRFGKLLISFKQECVRVTIERLDLTCQDGMSLEYFRQTCQEKGINLQEI